MDWSSKFLPTVATSTMEAEYMAAGAAAKTALWMRKMGGDYARWRNHSRC